MEKNFKIIFEGPDGAGKSTLAELVSQALELPLRGRITRVGPSNVFEVNKKDLTAPGVAVLDRCYWLSDLIYEPIYSNTPSVLQFMNMHEYDLLNTILVYVDCSDDAIKERIGDRGDELYSINQILKAANRYRCFFATYTRTLIKVDTSKKSLGENVSYLCNELRKYI